MTTFLASLHRRAAEVCPRIVFPEGTDARTLEAIGEIVAAGIARPLVLIPDRTHVAAVHARGAEALIPAKSPQIAAVAERLALWARERSRDEAEARAQATHPLAFANALVALDEADACVAGAVHTTADVLRWALRLIGASAASQSVSGAFYLVAPASGATWPQEVLTLRRFQSVAEPERRAVVRHRDRCRHRPTADRRR
ncbi:MAG: phosphate acyltransferase [Gemmatimonadaceae bacterium]|nr:phosphate acyltransferase [Gemmatimonadaceae bacterium]